MLIGKAERSSKIFLITDGVGVGVTVGVGDGVMLGLCDGVGDGVGEGSTEGVGLIEIFGVGETVEGVGIGLTSFFITTPLFQTNFFPLLTHVYFLPLYVSTRPSLGHTLPVVGGLTEYAEREPKEKKSEIARIKEARRFTNQR